LKKLFFAFAFLFILLFFCAGQTAFAQGNEPPIPAAPAHGNVVLDTLDWLTPDQEAEINSINHKLDQDGLAQIAVVTLNDCGADKKTFRNHLFNTWGIGHANDNDGLLILLCWYGGDKTRRSVEQEVGYGLESTLPGTLTDKVAREYFVTAFQENHPGAGLVAMVKGYDGLLRKPQLVAGGNPSMPSPIFIQPQGLFRDLIIGIGTFVGLIILIIIVVHIHTMRTNNSVHLTKREKVQEERERKELFLLIATLIVLMVSVFAALNLHFSFALIFTVVSELLIAAVSSWSYHGRIKKDDPNQDTSWFSNAGGGGRGGGGRGGGGGGGFGGGSSGGGGSSTGF
jgi:uncharacterized protein